MNPIRPRGRRPALDEREAPTMEHPALPDEDAPKYVTTILPKATSEKSEKKTVARESGTRAAFTDEDVERIERRERRETLPAPPDGEREEEES